MRSYKTDLLNYGLEKGYFTKVEHGWCMNGGNINALPKKTEEKKNIGSLTRKSKLMLAYLGVGLASCLMPNASFGKSREETNKEGKNYVPPKRRAYENDLIIKDNPECDISNPVYSRYGSFLNLKGKSIK